MDTKHFAGPGLRSEPRDLWTLYDAPHFEDVRNPLVFAAFLRSASTESVAYSSMFNTVAFRATGPDGGKVTFSAVRAYLEPQTYEYLMAAYEAAEKSGRSSLRSGSFQEGV